ncbi:2,6-beta-fructan 6-levanbiohydrolase (EC 3.2.1.64) [Arthrobacter sp. DR-2P]|nr:2,6-beta-fructan 6-levanbiohydrolase (EC 3.2.1.64) [Arthrobacter sp. DR-2P]
MVTMSEKPDLRTTTSRRTAWAVAAALAILAALVSTVVRIEGSSAKVRAEEALRNVATAQSASKDAAGVYASYWLTGGDHSLSAVHPVQAEGVADLRSISCDNGWVAAARVDGEIYVRSNLGKGAVAAGAGDLRRPSCVTDEALRQMLADVGLQEQSPGPKAAADRPPNSSKYRPSYHITPERNWMNDPQRPFFLNGLWHYYYLYNADYPDGNGTEWYHLTSEDLLTWKDEGVAIEKYKNGLGDIETGSTVVDHGNTAGFGHGAVISLLTQQDQGVQRQSLFYSTDGGYTFTPYKGNPVMDNPGAEHWRDPKIVWDGERSQWLMVLAEGHKIGMYTSSDLKEWHYASGFERTGLGTLECPDLFQLDVDGDPGKRTWVLAASANGTEEGRATGVAYWTGNWDGTQFTPRDGNHQWMDAGSDFYAAVTWDDPRLTEGQKMQSRKAIGWMNNWDYARKLPTGDWHGGMDTLIRDVRLKTVQGRPTLVSTPAKTLRRLEGEALGLQGATPDGTKHLPASQGGSYRLDATLGPPGPEDQPEARIHLESGGSAFATLGYNFRDGAVFLDRQQPPDADLGPLFTERRTVAAPAKDGLVKLTVFVDYSSVEVFINDGEQTLTSLVFPRSEEHAVRVATDKGTLPLKSLDYTPLSPAR